ncbi:MAG: type I methionyl aminopeptidase [Candidatus Azobacteroides pseudotrichonymphae]|jgi:methionyl aminopeptidase|uniref:Methionine aminopeptidase n=1 Tax=Azobacteroides pseudotrichonymphae genomovar. CFP2 TaxID=511995 RepID=B6YQ65_AZOPC|nr:type I methionyl aminopeptidase [Candidatus Azobacteroides pseudotrichonymphae]MDR0530130.1 type I methionyl aminopeptidase [Bacteroidales bacterium OttesenSCG-928-I14]BAG83337.1 methionyl aminopeptidase [Candidatus Azobacteroides pseudotrichonymphae genomovar. CFP2]GMO36991.1 MAG: type I methionyl aminopeptidase [Candidatus Azobacteroides pseudotrichonymphae]
MVCLKTDEEIELMRVASLLVSLVLAEVAKNITPGVITLQLDKIADEFICDHGGIPLFKGYKGFPNALCVSVNENVVHGIPGNYSLKNGDIVSVDCGVKINGYCGDSAYTFEVGEVDPKIKKLLQITKESLYVGINYAVNGKRLGDLGYAIQTYCEKAGYSIVRELVGHGIGREMHESPEVPNYGKKGRGCLLKAGMCIAIEPMVSLGSRNINFERDGWTVRTVDRKPSAHFEHTVAIRHEKADILSTFDFIEEILKYK